MGWGRAAPNPNPNPRQISLIRRARVTITTWRLRLTSLKMETSMDSIDLPTSLPRAHGVGLLEGITNITRLSSLTRLARITRSPILGNCLKW